MNLNSYKECLELVFGSSMPKKKTWTGQLDDDKGLPKVKVFELKGIGPSERKIAEQLGLRRHQVRRIIQKPVVDATKPATTGRDQPDQPPTGFSQPTIGSSESALG